MSPPRRSAPPTQLARRQLALSYRRRPYTGTNLDQWLVSGIDGTERDRPTGVTDRHSSGIPARPPWQPVPRTEGCSHGGTCSDVGGPRLPCEYDWYGRSYAGSVQRSHPIITIHPAASQHRRQKLPSMDVGAIFFPLKLLFCSKIRLSVILAKPVPAPMRSNTAICNTSCAERGSRTRHGQTLDASTAVVSDHTDRGYALISACECVGAAAQVSRVVRNGLVKTAWGS